MATNMAENLGIPANLLAGIAAENLILTVMKAQ